MITKELINELGQILKEEFSVKLLPEDLESLANFLVTYFEALSRSNIRQ